jgi:hypothetical protein
MDLMTRHIHAYGKLFRRLQTVDKHRFATLPGCTPLVLFYWDKVIEASKVSSDFIDGESSYALKLTARTHGASQTNRLLYIPSGFSPKP